jgi:uncharacterized membrane protein YphA (DoxX/SURF4 family)
MRGTLARDLLVFCLGLMLGYSFAAYGGGKLLHGLAGRKLLHGLAGRVSEVNLSHPVVVLILIGLVVVTLIFTSRRSR